MTDYSIRRHRKPRWELLCWAALLWQPALTACGEAPRTVSFAHDVRPILSEYCLHCHGPDANSREADLRLDQRQAFVAQGDTPGIVVAGEPGQSELLRRIVSRDDADQMPPPDSADRPTASEIETIRRWIAAGAVWQQHWALLKPERPLIPPVTNKRWPRNEIDHFVTQRLQQEQLTPSSEADRETLIRRVSLDLTGLPPTPTEVDQFLADQRPAAYERLVDRLLASPRYGEQMAASWLDAARYADTYGYQDDGPTSMWRWRDWVIEAFNANMPYEQFTIEQLAGDLLPSATFSQRIASAFNRNHRHNSEGGAIPEEFRVEYVVDRVDTTATVWLGLTVGCARCHDHKYDPITQREFYELFAFFNSVQEDGRARKEGNTPPLMPAPTREQLAEQQRIETRLNAALDRQRHSEPQLLDALETWQNRADRSTLPVWKGIRHDLDVHFRLDGDLADASNSDIAGSFVSEPASYVRGPLGQAAELDGKQTISFGDIGSFSSDDRITVTSWIRPTDGDGVVVSKIEDPYDPQEEGYTLLLRDSKMRLHFTSQWHDDAIRLQTETRLPLGRWTHVAMTYDGSHLAEGIQIYFDGVKQPLEIEFDSLYQGFGNKGSLVLGSAGDAANQFHGAIDELRIYATQLTPSEIALLAVQESIGELLLIAPSARTANQQRKLRTYFTEHFAPAKFREEATTVIRLQRELQEHRRGLPTLMIMQELAEPRTTHLLSRGQYDAPSEVVQPDVPDVFADLPATAPRNRLGLAQWLIDSDNPLTARVAVNRLWQMSFDRGLVRTTEDFGAQGERPSHPQLLDWLATELLGNGWDLQAIRRLIVTSATYRQRSHASTQKLAIDPQNRLLARGPRFRLAAEVIRDSALYASGLLVERLGGPSVKPYQPEGLWEELGDDAYQHDRGDNLYRRSLYTFWKRTVTHPLMSTFDAPSREVCTVREGRTNTPLQALALMNEAGLVEAARVLAERVLSECHESAADRLVRAFRLVTARHPQPAEIAILQQSLAESRAHFTKHPLAAKRLAAVGEYPRASHLGAIEVATYTTVANLLLNLDEVVTQH